MNRLLSCLILFASFVSQAQVLPPGSANNLVAGATAVQDLFISPKQSLTAGPGGNYPTITAAANAAASGMTVVVYPGTYFENNLLRPGVNYYFYPGTKLVWVDPVTNSVGQSTPGYGLFDDRATGATTNRIMGSMDFYYSIGSNFFSGFNGNTNCVGALVLTNPASDIVFTFNSGDGDAFENNGGGFVQTPINGFVAAPSLLYISRTRNCVIRCNDLTVHNTAATFLTFPNFMLGLYWEIGPTYIDAVHIGPNTVYAIWANEQPGTTDVSDLYVNGEACEGYIYDSGASSNWRQWYNFSVLTVTNNVTYQWAMAQYGGHGYLTAEKVEVRDNNGICVQCQNAGQLWVRAEKMTATGTGGWAGVQGANSKLWINCDNYTYSTSLPSTGASVGFNCSSSGTLYLNGGIATTSGTGLLHSGTLTELKAITIDASSGTKAACATAGAGLSVKGSTLLVASSTNAISATSSQTVGAYWSAANYDKDSHITLTPNAGWTVSTSAK